MMLEAQGIRKEFIRQGKGTNRLVAVQDTDLTLGAGELTVLMGRSGSGKSTLLNMLAGLLAPTAGRILLDGEDLYAMEDRALSRLRNARIGVIPQGQTALHSLTVLENVLLPVRMYDPKADAAPEALALLERLGIAELQQDKPAALSGGELRRMAIARAVIRRPQIILADEPTGDLDDENTAIVFDFLRESARNGAAVLVVTHEGDAVQYADRIYRMNAGVLTVS
ncbi:MAG: ABC transporter ATP-binding protein [Oscillospiraceae bacterium]|nr:ABC transporter ATP-binding protein [Oscillospiraceae bacterium]